MKYCHTFKDNLQNIHQLLEDTHVHDKPFIAESQAAQASPSSDQTGKVTSSGVAVPEQVLKVKEEPYSKMKFNFTIESIKAELYKGDSGLVRLTIVFF